MRKPFRAHDKTSDGAVRTFPEELRIGIGQRFEAAGRRAHAASREDGGVDVRIDDAHALLRTTEPAGRGEVEDWAFGAAREGEMLFVAPDQPVVVYEVQARGRIAAEHDPRLRVATEVGDTRVRAVVHPASMAPPAADALIASAIARARRRSAQRPRLFLGPASDPMPAAEHALRLALARDPAVGTRKRAAAVLALLALNDGDGALHVLREAGTPLERDPHAAMVLTGAWAAWRGTAIPVESVRGAAHLVQDADDAWAELARALAPFAADVLKDGHAGRPADARDPALAILRAAGLLPEALRVLAPIHQALGLMPDAVRARVRLAPRLEPGRTHADQITAGDAVLSIDAEVGEERATLSIEQSDGPAPYRAIMEPRLPGGRLRSAVVDGSPAELDAGVVDGELRVSVQLVVDQRRNLVLDYDRR